MRPAGLEPATHSLEGCCSIHLSYGRVLLDNNLDDSELPATRVVSGVVPEGCERPKYGAWTSSIHYPETARVRLPLPTYQPERPRNRVFRRALWRSI